MTRRERRPGVVNINIYMGEDCPECPDCPGEWTGPWAPDNTMGGHELMALYRADQLAGFSEGDVVETLPDLSGNGHDAAREDAMRFYYHIDENGHPYLSIPDYGFAGFRNNTTPATGNDPVLIMLVGEFGNGPAGIGDGSYAHGLFPGPDHLYGFWMNDFYYGGIGRTHPLVMFLGWDGQSLFMIMNNTIRGTQKNYHPMDIEAGFSPAIGCGSARWYAAAAWHGFLDAQDREAAIEWSRSVWFTPMQTVAKLRHWYETRGQGLPYNEVTNSDWSLSYDLSERPFGIDRRIGSFDYHPMGKPYVKPLSARYGNGFWDIVPGNEPRTVAWAGEADSGTCFVMGHSDLELEQWGITGEKLILGPAGTSDVPFTTPVRSGPTVLIAQYDPATQKTSVWDRDTLVLEYTHPAPLTTVPGFYLFDSVAYDENAPSINPAAGAFYGYAHWDGLLTGGEREDTVNYFRALYVDWNDLTREAGVIYGCSDAGDPPERVTHRFTNELIGFTTGWSPDDTAWWQIQFPEAEAITRLDLVPRLDGGDFIGIPHVELFGSNIGDFTGEEVSLFSGELTNTDFAYNHFEFANSTAYTYYRALFSGSLENGKYGLRQVYIYRDDRSL